MTLVTLPSPIHWPGILGQVSGGPSLGTVATIDAAGEYVSYIICAKEDMTISHVSFRAGTATGSPNVVVSIEGVDASGLPDGAATYGGSASAATLVSSNTNPVIALGGSATVTKGQVFCVKIAYSSGTSLIIQNLGSVASLFNNVLPYQVLNTGTPTKGLIGMALLALGSSSSTFYNVPGFINISGYSAGAFNNTNSAKRGLKFTIPMNCRAIGVRWYNSNSSGNFNAVLYDNAGTPAEFGSTSTAFDGDHNATTANAAGIVYFDTAATLVAGTTYRLVIEPSSATNVNVSVFTIPTDQISATPASSYSVATYTTFATATWTDSTTQLPLMDLIIDQLDDGSGTGGVVGVIGG
jgi:hypothetical protein